MLSIRWSWSLSVPGLNFLLVEATGQRWSVPQPAEMASDGASTVLGVDVAMNPGASMTPFMTLPFPLSTTGPTHRPPWEQHLLPLKTTPFVPGHSLVLPALSRTPLVAEDAGHGPVGTGPCNIMVQVRSEAEQPQCSQTQTIVLNQASLNWSAPAAICGGSACPALVFVEASMVEKIMLTSTFGDTQAGEGGWCASLPPQAPPPAAQLAPFNPPVNAGPQPHGASRKGDLATSQSKASPDDSCNPKSVYKNFQCWQHFKALAQRHLPQSSDAEALSCFLICMEFEVKEETQIQKLQQRKGVQGLPPSDPLRPDSHVPPDPVVGPQPECIPREAVPRAQSAHRCQQPWETKAPNDISPEVVKGYLDIMDGLLGLADSGMREPDGEWGEDRRELQQEEDGTYLDPGLLNYIDKLCFQEDFVTKVEEVIHPRYLTQLLSPEAQLDLLALAEELLEQEEGLTLVQLLEKLRLASKEEDGVQAPLSLGAPQLDSSLSESVASQDTQRPDHSPQLGVNNKACPPENDFKDHQRHCRANIHLSKPKAFAVSSGRQECPLLWARYPSSAPLGDGCTYSGLGPRDASIPRQTSLVRDRPMDRFRKNEEHLPHLAFPLASPNSLLSCPLSLSPDSASSLACPGGQGSWEAAQSQPQKRKCEQPVTGGRRKRHCSQDGAVRCPSSCQSPGGPD